MLSPGEGFVFLEWLVEPSVEQPLERNKRVKRITPKSECNITQKDLLDGLMGCFIYLLSTVRPVHFSPKTKMR